jgi:hypothetical protein
LTYNPHDFSEYTVNRKWSFKSIFPYFRIYSWFSYTRFKQFPTTLFKRSRLRHQSYSTHVSVRNHFLVLVVRSRIFLPWRLWRYVPPKRRFTQNLNVATSQKTAFFIVNAVKTSTYINLIHSSVSVCLQNARLCRFTDHLIQLIY